MSIRNILKKPDNQPRPAAADDACVLLEGPEDFDAAVASRDRLMIMLYAAWCPFSQEFLPIYLAHAAAGDPCYARIIVDDDDPLVERYGISVFPTLLFFEKGQLVRRLDGTYHRGLTHGQLRDFARRCAVR